MLCYLASRHDECGRKDRRGGVWSGGGGLAVGESGTCPVVRLSRPGDGRDGGRPGGLAGDVPRRHG